MKTTTTQHTPGPWRISDSQYGAVVSDHPVPGINGSDAVEHYGGHLIAESIAPQNRAIIAAAPELLDALKRLAHGTAGPGSASHLQALAQANAAIAKAEGRA